MKIILTGFAGSGKSTVAERLADMLNIKNIEMDDLALVKSKRKSIQEIFEKDGEECFRKLEAQVASELSNREDIIVVAGGEVGIDKELLNVLGGVSIYLKTDFTEIEKRLKSNKERTLFQNIEEARKLYAKRESLYEKNADHIISTDNKEIDNVVQEIIKKIFFMCEGGSCQSCSGCH